MEKPTRTPCAVVIVVRRDAANWLNHVSNTRYGLPSSIAYLNLTILNVRRETRRPRDQMARVVVAFMPETQAVAVQD